MADVLIILIVLILARFVYYYVFDTYSLPKFIMVAVGLQVVHDLLFYALFTPFNISNADSLREA